MIILHYIPNLTKKAGQAAKSVQILHAALARSVESHLYTGNATSIDFYRYIQTLRPDIIHLHGCWDIQLAFANIIARHLSIPVITSPHGQLSPSSIQKDFWKTKLPRILFYQFLTIRHSFAIQASTENELNDLKNLGWKKRIVAIPIAKDSVEGNAMVSQQIAFYTKVIDTTLRNKLSEEEKNSFWKLIAIDIESKHGNQSIDQAIPTSINALNADNWKHLLIYAIDHNVYDRIISAVNILGITIPHPLTAVPPRYPRKAIWKGEKTVSLSADILNEYKDHQEELKLTQDINTLHNTVISLQKTEDCQYPLPLFLEIYENLQWKYYNEELFEEIATKAKLKKFTAELLNTYNQVLGLPIGFMPFDPVKDGVTTKIINNLNNLP